MNPYGRPGSRTTMLCGLRETTSVIVAVQAPPRLSVRRFGVPLAGGADYAPLGVRSSLLHTVRAPFMEFGTKRNLFSGIGHGVSLLGSYGHSEGNRMSVNVMRFGGQYAYQFSPASVLSLYGGHRLAYGSLGIPGYRQAGAEPVSFVDHLPEARLSFVTRW